jgi:hypothetical protein
MSAELPAEVFLSHSSSDWQFASELAAVLRRHGIRVWYSQTNILGAQQWQDEIGAALERCDWFVVILSPQSVESMWVRRELSFALGENRFENKIVPIIYQPADYRQLSWTLRLFEMVDFSGSVEAGYVELFRIWGLPYHSNTN